MVSINRQFNTIGIDAALRATGIAYLGSDGCRHKVAKLGRKLDRDQLFDLARFALEDIAEESRVDLVCVEFHPFAIPGRRVNLHSTMGYASGVWQAAARTLGFPAITVPVATWRRVVLSRGKGSIGKGKAGANIMARAIAAAYKQPPPETTDEAEAICLALYGQTHLRTGEVGVA